MCGCALRDRLFHHRPAACHSHGYIHRPAEYGPLSSDRGHNPLPTSGWAEGAGAGRQLSRGAGSCPARFRRGATHSGNRAGVTFPGRSHGAFSGHHLVVHFGLGQAAWLSRPHSGPAAHLPWPDILSPLSLEIRTGGRNLGDQGIEEPVVQKKPP